MNWYRILRPAIFCLEPEKAHCSAIWALKNNLLPKQSEVVDSRLEIDVAGLHFKNPVGLAPGFDKNAEAIQRLASLGFGFIEAGTVTPLPQEGNPKPRLFRLEKDEAVINRMGFNNKGASVFERNLSYRNDHSVILGVNIGKNKTSSDAAADYVLLLEKFYAQSDYITVNISSPNTPGLRALQQEEALGQLLSALMQKRVAMEKQHKRKVPLFLKIAPDMTEGECKAVASCVLKHQVDALIVSNTTVGERHRLKSQHADEAGGLSGKPLFSLSTAMLKQFYRLTEGKIPLIGVGGIASAEDAYTKIRAGASLIQLYSALIYHGFSLVNEINRGLLELLERDGFSHISDAIGVDATDIKQ